MLQHWCDCLIFIITHYNFELFRDSTKNISVFHVCFSEFRSKLSSIERTSYSKKASLDLSSFKALKEIAEFWSIKGHVRRFVRLLAKAFLSLNKITKVSLTYSGDFLVSTFSWLIINSSSPLHELFHLQLYTVYEAMLFYLRENIIE